MEGAVLALYPAKRVASDDLEAHPSGYYLEKKGELPANWTVLDERNQKKTVTAKWTVGKTPMAWEDSGRRLYSRGDRDASGISDKSNRGGNPGNF